MSAKLVDHLVLDLVNQLAAGLPSNVSIGALTLDAELDELDLEELEIELDLEDEDDDEVTLQTPAFA